MKVFVRQNILDCGEEIWLPGTVPSKNDIGAIMRWAYVCCILERFKIFNIIKTLKTCLYLQIIDNLKRKHGKGVWQLTSLMISIYNPRWGIMAGENCDKFPCVIIPGKGVWQVACVIWYDMAGGIISISIISIIHLHHSPASFISINHQHHSSATSALLAL